MHLYLLKVNQEEEKSRKAILQSVSKLNKAKKELKKIISAEAHARVLTHLTKKMC